MAFSVCLLNPYPCKQGAFTSRKIQCRAGIPSTVSPRPHPDKQAAVTWVMMGELRGRGACGEGLPLLQSSEERRSREEDFAVPFVAQLAQAVKSLSGADDLEVCSTRSK